MRAPLSLLLIYLFCVDGRAAQDGTQTDWSGGGGAPGPVSFWDDAFDGASNASWLSVPGQFALSSVAQGSPTEHKIANAQMGFGVYPADLDGDGDLDVAGTLEGAQKVLWWSNEGGDPLGWTEQVIDGGLAGANGLYCADFDLDGRVDVAVSASGINHHLIWYRNDGGEPVQWTEQVIDSALSTCFEISAADVNQDGRPDLLAGSWNSGQVVWYENSGGAPLTWVKHVIAGAFPGSHCVKAGDIDGDGDVDVAATAGQADEVAWWRNDGGTPLVWTKHTIRTGFTGGRSVELADLDRDGDLDVAGTCWASEATWWRNDGGDPIAWTEQVIDGSVNGGHHIRVADVNGDGRPDVLVAAFLDHDVVWFENGGGTPITWTRRLVKGLFPLAVEVGAADLDGDGALEILAASYANGGKFSWWDTTDFVESGELTSSILDTGVGLPEARLSWNATTPSETALVFQVRSSDDSSDLGPWSAGHSVPATVGDLERYVQYRALIGTRNPEHSPIVREVRLEGLGDWVLSERKISETQGGFGGALDPGDRFGMALAALGDLDGDGVGDLAIGSESDDDGGSGAGAVWILFMHADGTVKAEQKISATSGGFTGALGSSDSFGVSIDALGDLDGDGVVDLAVGAWGDDDGGFGRGALWILFLNPDGTLKAEQKISQTSGGFGGTLSNEDTLGVSVACLGDLDGDGVVDLASGADHDDDGGNERGAVWVIFLNPDGTVKTQQKISSTEGGLAGPLPDDSYFGVGIAAAGDLNYDGTCDLAVGLGGSTGGGSNRGAVWVLHLNPDGSVESERLFGSGLGGFEGQLTNNDWFGFAIESIGDHDQDGFLDLAVGAPYDGDDANNQGSVWLLFLEGGQTSVFCETSPNSHGPGAYIGSSGPTSIATNDFTLTVTGSVPDTVGLFLYSAGQTEVPFGDGLRCIGGGDHLLFRLLPPSVADSAGLASHWLDFDAPPASVGAGAIVPGSTWFFQYWYRDPAGSGSGFNLSDGLRVRFDP